MREIKFRAWDKDSKVMREIQHLVRAEDNLIAHCPPRGHDFSEWFTVILNGWEYQLMEYTGLKDKNGVEIYEGDIVRVMLSNYEKLLAYVEWFGDEGYPAFDLHQVNEAFYFDSNVLSTVMNDGSEVEVIGNIYENSELLDKNL